MKKIVLYILSFFLFISPIYALAFGENSSGYERTEANNYGVTKVKEIKSLENVLKTPYVDPTLKIYDYANILTSEEEKELKSLIDGFVEQTNLDFVFVSFDMPYYSDSENEIVAQDFYDYNDFGQGLPKNGGVLLYRNTYSSDPYYGSVLTGEAMLYCNESCNDNILDNIYDSFHNGRYEEGITSFIHMFNSRYESGYDEEKYYIDDNGSLRENKDLNPIPSVVTGAIATILGMLGLVKKNKMVKKASNANDYLVESSINYKNKSDRFVSTVTTQTRINTDSGGGGSHSGFGSSGVGHISGGRHG